jgi:hypothetical protein
MQNKKKREPRQKKLIVERKKGFPEGRSSLLDSHHQLSTQCTTSPPNDNRLEIFVPCSDWVAVLVCTTSDVNLPSNNKIDLTALKPLCQPPNNNNNNNNTNNRLLTD